MHNTTLFLTLRVFSATGGIEKVCRVAGKAMHELSQEANGQAVKIFSLYDEPAEVNTIYFPASIFKGFGKSRFHFFYTVLRQGIGSRQVMLSHVNLLLVGYIIKLFSPKTKLVLFAHGIEVWSVFPAWKKRMLRQCDLILPVSHFTKMKLMQQNGLDENRMTILNNCLDPFLPLPLSNTKPSFLLRRYGIDAADKVLLTLTRMAHNEQYKGYEQVIDAVNELKHHFPTIKYLLVGKYDAAEKARLDEIIDRLCLQEHIIFSGFISDAELAAHYALADLYIMPSQKEGFGIVFIEAMFYGKPVIAGNVDGSVDALQNGTFGVLVNPTDPRQIKNAIVEVLNDTQKFTPKKEAVLRHFGFEVYKEMLRGIFGERSY